MANATGPDWGIEWHLERLASREAGKLAGLTKLINLARSIAGQQRNTLVEQRLVSALYLPTLAESTLAVADVLAELCPTPSAA